MITECNDNQREFEFQGLKDRRVVGAFNGGQITSDGGSLLLREVERRRGILKQFSECFEDHRDERYIEHTVKELVSQRAYGICLGYEDLNDHDTLRLDPLLATLSGKEDPTGLTRRRPQDQGKALAGKSTLNRLELTPKDLGKDIRYKKIVYDKEKIDSFFVKVFLDSFKQAPSQIILDLDATDDLIHGKQEGRFFHGYYGNYCYLPLYIFCGDFLLCARLRTSDQDASAGSVEELERIVHEVRKRWPEVKIILRADSGFAREALMAWCEGHHVDYLFGLAKNERLNEEIKEELQRAKDLFEEEHKAQRLFKDFQYQTLKSWSRARRVVGKAEHLEKGSNPRFVVTSLSMDEIEAQRLYEELYCARGDMENRIKEQQLYLFADRTSAETMRANQLRLWFSSVSYLLMNELRRIGLQGTELAKAQCQTIRNKILKVGALVRVSLRRVWVWFASAYPYQKLFRDIYERLKKVDDGCPA